MLDLTSYNLQVNLAIEFITINKITTRVQIVYHLVKSLYIFNEQLVFFLGNMVLCLSNVIQCFNYF